MQLEHQIKLNMVNLVQEIRKMVVSKKQFIQPDNEGMQKFKSISVLLKFPYSISSYMLLNNRKNLDKLFSIINYTKIPIFIFCIYIFIYIVKIYKNLRHTHKIFYLRYTFVFVLHNINFGHCLTIIYKKDVLSIVAEIQSIDYCML